MMTREQELAFIKKYPFMPIVCAVEMQALYQAVCMAANREDTKEFKEAFATILVLFPWMFAGFSMLCEGYSVEEINQRISSIARDIAAKIEERNLLNVLH